MTKDERQKAVNQLLDEFSGAITAFAMAIGEHWRSSGAERTEVAKIVKKDAKHIIGLVRTILFLALTECLGWFFTGDWGWVTRVPGWVASLVSA